jgi:hypothetical protein
MTAQNWDDDQALLADLGQALAEDAGTPDRVREIGRAAFAWRSVDADLVTLFADELDPEPVRAGDGPQAHAFSGTVGGAEVGVEVERDDGILRGQLVPPGSGRIDVLGGAGGPTSADISDDGYFVVRDLPATAIRLRVSTAAGDFLTPWFD